METIADFLAAAARPFDLKSLTVEKDTVALVPQGFTAVPLEPLISKLRPTPDRVRVFVAVQDVASFAKYFLDFKTDATLLTGTPAPPRIIAHIDYHSDSVVPSWCTHRCMLELTQSEEWKIWHGSSGKSMRQEDFAQFIEDNAMDVVDPEPTRMMEIARDLEAKKEVSFQSVTRLDNGQRQFKYQEQITGRTVSGTIEVPQKFMINIPVYYGAERAPITCRFRYRINQGNLSLSYEMDRPVTIVERAFRAVVSQVQEATGLPVLIGTVGAKE